MIRTIFLSSFVFFSMGILASPLPLKPHVYVEGSASIEVSPDEISFSVTLARTELEVAQAKSDVDLRAHKLISLCKEVGIDEKDIATSTLRVNPSFTYKENQRVPNGTTVSRDVDIRLRNLSKYPEVIRALVDSDISQTISTKLHVSNEDELTDDALVKAMKDAHQRAIRLAETQGRKLGEVYSISEFMTRGEERYMLSVSRHVAGRTSSEILTDVMLSAPSEPFEPGVMVAKAQVFVVYLLK